MLGEFCRAHFCLYMTGAIHMEDCVNSDLGAVSVHVARTFAAPSSGFPGLAVRVEVGAGSPALATGLGTVDRHPAGVLIGTKSTVGPSLARPVVVPAARGRLCRLHRGPGSHTSSHLGLAGTLVESVELPDIRVRKRPTLSYLKTATAAGLGCDRLQTSPLNRTRPWTYF